MTLATILYSLGNVYEIKTPFNLKLTKWIFYFFLIYTKSNVYTIQPEKTLQISLSCKFGTTKNIMIYIISIRCIISYQWNENHRLIWQLALSCFHIAIPFYVSFSQTVDCREGVSFNCAENEKKISTHAEPWLFLFKRKTKLAYKQTQKRRNLSL